MNRCASLFILIVLVEGPVLGQLDSSDHEPLPISLDTSETLLEKAAIVYESSSIDVLAESDATPRAGLLSLRSRLLGRTRSPRGYQDSTYLGSSNKLYQRVRITPNKHLLLAALATKDPGESRLNDFSSAHFVVSNVGVIKKCILGDYRVEIGQGLLLWRGYDFTKGVDVVTPVIRRPGGVLRGLTSDEVNFFRGGAIEVEKDGMRGIVFYSIRSLGGSLDDSGRVTSLYASGYYRTSGEITKRDVVAERLMGGSLLKAVGENGSVSLSITQSNFNKRLYFDDGLRFNDDAVQSVSASYTVDLGSSRFVGEWARSGRTLGGINSVVVRPGRELTFVASYRFYPPTFFSPHGLGFGERSGTSNENGVYLGLSLRVSPTFHISSYFDRFRFPEPSSRSGFPTGGNDYMLNLDFRPARSVNVMGRYYCSHTDVGHPLSGTTTASSNDQRRLQRLRLQLEVTLPGGSRLRTRAERVYLDWARSVDNQKGLLVYQDIVMKPASTLWMNLRISFYNTDSYDTRIAVYERDLDGVIALPLVYGAGIRWYALIRYSPFPTVDVSVKYSSIIRDDVRTLGSGPDQLPTNRDDRFGIQLDFQL